MRKHGKKMEGQEIRLEIVIYKAKETTFFHNFVRYQVMIGVTLFF